MYIIIEENIHTGDRGKFWCEEHLIGAHTKVMTTMTIGNLQLLVFHSRDTEHPIASYKMVSTFNHDDITSDDEWLKWSDKHPSDKYRLQYEWHGYK